MGFCKTAFLDDLCGGGKLGIISKKQKNFEPFYTKGWGLSSNII